MEIDDKNVFLRKFRWRLEGKYLPSYFAKSVRFNYAAKTITLSYYDVIDNEGGMHAFIWADSLQSNQLSDEELTFTTMDGRGKELYCVVFKGLSLLDHATYFDYLSSDPSTTELIIKYDVAHKNLSSREQ